MSEPNFSLVSCFLAPAIDSLCQERPSRILTIACRALASLVNLVSLPILGSIDAIRGLSLGLSNRKNLTAAGRSFVTVLGTPWCIATPDAGTFHSLQPHINTDNDYIDGSKIYTSKEVQIRTPENIDQVIDAIQKAKEQRMTVSVRGAGFSQGGHTVSGKSSILLDMCRINNVTIVKGNGRSYAKVGSGAIWGEIQKAANAEHLALITQQASNVFSVGGSISTNIHGWDVTGGSLGNQIRSVTIVNANGAIERIEPHHKLFKAVIGGYGALGVIVEAELYLTSNDYLRKDTNKMSLSSYLETFDQQVLGNSNILMHCGRLDTRKGQLFENVMSVSYHKAEDRPGNDTVPNEPEGGGYVERRILHFARRAPTLALLFKQEQEKAHCKKHPVHTRGHWMSPNIRQIANNSQYHADWLQEYFIPKSKMYEFLQEFRRIATHYNIDLLNATLRYVPKNDNNSLLGYAKEDCLAIVFFFNQSIVPHKLAETDKWTKALIEKANELKGSYYLTYHRGATLEQFREAYPHWKEFAELKRQEDPQDVFSNQFLETYFKK